MQTEGIVEEPQRRCCRDPKGRRDLTKALAEVAKLQQQGIVPAIAPPPQK